VHSNDTIINKQIFFDTLEQSVACLYVSQNNILKEKSIKFIQNGGSAYIWPAGEIGREFYNRINESGYTNIKLVDLNAHFNLDYVIHPNEISNCNDSVVVIASLKQSNSIYFTAKEMGFKYIVMYYDIVDIIIQELQVFPDDFHIQLFIDRKQHLLKNKKSYIDMYNSLCDDLSKTRFIEDMMFRLTNDIIYTFPKDDDQQYFNSLIKEISNDTVIVDGGGYTGDTLEKFLIYSNNKYKNYYLFEPDNNLLEQAKTVSNDERIHYICKGLSKDKGETRYISTGGLGGAINERGDTSIYLTSIDKEISGKVTLIKMDIEGAELDALKGAKGTIKKYKPELAICIYHKANDYIDIFEFIRNINNEYKFFIRHHSNYYGESVLYAI